MMNKRVSILIALTIFVFYSCITTKQHSVNQEKYLGNKINSSDIYTDKLSNCFYSPLNLNIDPMDKLLLIDFIGDSIYETIELQVYNDSRGKGATVILYRIEGGSDVYYSDSAFVSTILFKGNLYENKDMKYSLNVSKSGLDAFIELNDKFGRNIKAKVKEESNTNKPISFLAPIGGIINTFTFFPVFYMKGFDFVKQAGTNISIEIANQYLKPKRIPLLLNGKFVYLSRYSTEPVICSINDEYNGELRPMIPTLDSKFNDGNVTYELLNNDNHYEVKKISCSNSINNVSISFSPAIPDFFNLKNGVTISGRFSIEIDSITGIVAGEYQISRVKDEINFTMNPLKAYSPMTGPLWVLAYKWNADITITDNSVVKVISTWLNSSKE